MPEPIKQYPPHHPCLFSFRDARPALRWIFYPSILIHSYDHSSSPVEKMMPSEPFTISFFLSFPSISRVLQNLCFFLNFGHRQFSTYCPLPSRLKSMSNKSTATGQPKPSRQNAPTYQHHTFASMQRRKDATGNFIYAHCGELVSLHGSRRGHAARLVEEFLI